MTTLKETDPRFEVAFSFSGENRAIVQDMANALAQKLGKERIFYDRWHEAELARPDADIYLYQIYSDSRLIVVFQGNNHEQPWVQQEWNAIRNIILHKKQSSEGGLEILPLRFAGVDVPTVFGDIVSTDVTSLSVDELVAIVIDRLEALQIERIDIGPDKGGNHALEIERVNNDDLKPDVFISYSWVHDKNDPLVDDLCSALKAINVNIVRDKTSIEPGGRISKFMDRFAKSGCVIVILSDSYMKSEYCMYELYSIYVSAKHDDSSFLNRIIPVIHSSIKIARPIDRIQFAAFWKHERDELDAAARKYGPDVLGYEDHKALRRMSEFAMFVSDMLAYLNDKCIPRDIETVRNEDFKAICDLVRNSAKQAN